MKDKFKPFNFFDVKEAQIKIITIYTMKKIITILVLVFAFTLTTQAQKKGGKNQAENMLKKLTTDLNLSEVQQNKIKPLLVAQIADRKEMAKKRKEMRDSGEKPSKEERKKMRNERDAKETAMNSEMAKILNEEQFAKFEIITKEMKENAKKRNLKNKKERQ